MPMTELELQPPTMGSSVSVPPRPEGAYLASEPLVGPWYDSHARIAENRGAQRGLGGISSNCSHRSIMGGKEHERPSFFNQSQWKQDIKGSSMIFSTSPVKTFS